MNEQPEVMGTTAIDHAENEGTALANASYSATDPEGANIIWSVGGIDKGFFAISSGGVLSFAAEPDFEARPRDNTYEVTVRATEEDDVDALTGTLDVTVTVTDVDEPELLVRRPSPLIGLDFTAAFKRGDGRRRAVSNVGVGALDEPSGDGDGDRRGDGGDVPSGRRRLRQLPARDRLLQRWAQREDPAGDLRVDHVAGQQHEQTAGVPEPPVRGRRDRPLGRRERDRGNGRRRGAAGDRPGARHAQLLPRGYRLHHRSAVRDQRHLKADPGRQRRGVLDHEDQDSYSVTVTAKDEYNATGTADVRHHHQDVNEPPVVRRRSGAGAFSIVENSGTDVGSFVATDPEGGGVTWSLATSGDHGRFEIDAANGALSFKEAPDFERSDLGSTRPTPSPCRLQRWTTGTR